MAHSYPLRLLSVVPAEQHEDFKQNYDSQKDLRDFLLKVLTNDYNSAIMIDGDIDLMDAGYPFKVANSAGFRRGIRLAMSYLTPNENK